MSQTIAFIPARGGSKSIPLKNIKPFCGQPLIYWNLQALEDCPQIDKVVVATDAYQIAEVVQDLGQSKTDIYKRSADNAQDHSTTESVLLEYLSTADLLPDDRVVLVQCTSPFTTSAQFSEALMTFEQRDADSLLSVVRTKRFFWTTESLPLNYNPAERPRRQDFDGLMMENGAFYINTVGGILSAKNRLSGSIALYEMPAYTGLELDEEDDWLIGEILFRKYNSRKI